MKELKRIKSKIPRPTYIHTHRRSIQETLACEDAFPLHTQHPHRISSIRAVHVWETAPHAAGTIISNKLAVLEP